MSSFAAAGADVVGDDLLVLEAGRGGDLGGVVSVAGGLGLQLRALAFRGGPVLRSPAH
jgi:hypothetical protein